MKRIAIRITVTLTALLFFTVLLGACADKDEPATEPTLSSAVSTADDEPVTAGSATSEANDVSNDPNDNKNGFVFTYKDTPIAIQANATDIIQLIGEPMDTFESPSCAFEGIDKIMYYPGFILHTYPVNGEDYVLSVTFADDSIGTDEGVCLGDPYSKVIDVYGEPLSNEDGALIYELYDTSLRFIIEDDFVTDITYYSDAILGDNLDN